MAYIYIRERKEKTERDHLSRRASHLPPLGVDLLVVVKGVRGRRTRRCGIVRRRIPAERPEVAAAAVVVAGNCAVDTIAPVPLFRKRTHNSRPGLGEIHFYVCTYVYIRIYAHVTPLRRRRPRESYIYIYTHTHHTAASHWW